MLCAISYPLDTPVLFWPTALKLTKYARPDATEKGNGISDDKPVAGKVLFGQRGHLKEDGGRDEAGAGPRGPIRASCRATTLEEKHGAESASRLWVISYDASFVHV